jgi:rare lipoprotein A
VTRARSVLALAVLATLACAHPTRSTYRPARAEPGDDGRRAAPAPVPEPPPATEPRPDGDEEDRVERGEESGLASFYAHRFHGRRTASGVRYDMHAMTCAHPTAPFGSRLKVTDVETGRSVVVVVNDRGPFARGRVVDLSLAAAKRLGMVKRGVARVTVEPLD